MTSRLPKTYINMLLLLITLSITVDSTSSVPLALSHKLAANVSPCLEIIMCLSLPDDRLSHPGWQMDLSPTSIMFVSVTTVFAPKLLSFR